MLFDYNGTRGFISEVVQRYERTAPPVARYADDVYERLGEGRDVLVREIQTLADLRENDIWLDGHYAANLIYHLEESLGRDTTGQAGF
jgi:hypothetical protein